MNKGNVWNGKKYKNTVRYGYDKLLGPKKKKQLPKKTGKVFRRDLVERKLRGEMVLANKSS